MTGSPPRLLRFTAFVTTLDRFAMPPMFLAIARDIDAPVSAVVGAAGAYFLAYGLMQPVWGLLSARIGPVRLLRLSLLFAASATAATSLASEAVTLTVARALAGAGFSNAYPTALFYAGTTATAEHRHREVTGLMAGVALGTSVATAGGGLVAATLSWRVAFLVTGVAGLVLWLALRRLPELTSPRPDGIAAPLLTVVRTPAAGLLLLLAAVEGAVLLGTLTFLPAAAERGGSSPAVAGGVTAVYGLAVLVFARVVGRAQRRVPPAALIAIGAAFATAGGVVAATTARPWAIAVVCLCVGAAWASMHSTLQTWSTVVAPRAGLASVSLFAFALFAGSALATVLGGGLAEDGRFSMIFTSFAVMAVPLGVAAALARARWRPDAAATDERGEGDARRVRPG
jgi:predicted MFS family arabinose efflux permease